MKMQNENITRLLAGMQAAVEILDNATPITEWALITFGNGIEIKNPFSKNTSRILESIKMLDNFFLTPIADAVKTSAEYLTEYSTGEEKIIILISDCIPTIGKPGSIEVNKLLENDIKIYILCPKNKDEEHIWYYTYKTLAELTGGGFFYTSSTSELIRELFSENFNIFMNIDDNNSSTLLIFIKIIIFLIILITSLFIVNKIITIKTKKIENTDEIGLLTIKLEIKHPKDNRIEKFTRFPINIGYNNENSIDLQYLKPENEKTGFSIIPGENNVIYKSVKPILVNGVLRKEKQLIRGDRIALQQYRIIYSGYNKKTTTIKEEPKNFKFETFFLSILIFLLFLLPDNISGQDRIEENTKPATIQETGITLPLSPEITGQSEIEIITPDEIPDFYKADMLFIHAHPDDESLDFGGLIAKASLSGKRIVVIILTDGEAGLDQFPYRITGDNYPEYKLTGTELSNARIQECGRALSILGAETYIRLGLKNLPYTTILQEKNVFEIINIWGGEEYLINYLKILIEGYKPEIIVSHDGPSDAHEHFEHRAAGYITEKTIARIKRSAPDLIKAYIVSVDPLQRSFYPNSVAIDVITPVEDGLSPRYLQITALFEHITQADASVIGIEVLSNFSKEYYDIVFWNLDNSIEQYIF